MILLLFEDCYCNLVTADDNLEGVGDFLVILILMQGTLVSGKH